LFVEAKRVRGVVVEKPCDVRADGARALAAAAKANGVLVDAGDLAQLLCSGEDIRP